VRAKASRVDESCSSSPAQRRFEEGAARRTAARPVSLFPCLPRVVVATLVVDDAEKEPCVVGGNVKW
jgi:hypothetical protein